MPRKIKNTIEVIKIAFTSFIIKEMQLRNPWKSPASSTFPHNTVYHWYRLLRRTVNVVTLHTMRTYGGMGRGGSVVSLILNLGTNCRPVVRFTPRPLYSVKYPSVPPEPEGWVRPTIGLDTLDKRINGAIRRRFGKQMNKETKLRIHNVTAKAALKFGSKAWVLKCREE